MVQMEGCVTQGGKNGNENERMKTNRMPTSDVYVSSRERRRKSCWLKEEFGSGQGVSLIRIRPEGTERKLSRK